jgi:hypothetical protein
MGRPESRPQPQDTDFDEMDGTGIRRWELLLGITTILIASYTLIALYP